MGFATLIASYARGSLPSCLAPSRFIRSGDRYGEKAGDIPRRSCQGHSRRTSKLLPARIRAQSVSRYSRRGAVSENAKRRTRRITAVANCGASFFRGAASQRTRVEIDRSQTIPAIMLRVTSRVDVEACDGQERKSNLKEEALRRGSRRYRQTAFEFPRDRFLLIRSCR